MKTSLIGRSTTTWFDFSSQPPAPVFEIEPPKDGVLYCVSKKVVPAERRDDPAVVVLEQGLVEDYAGRLKAHMNALEARLGISGIREKVKQEIQQEQMEELQYRAENPEEIKLRQAVLGVIMRAFDAVPVNSDKTRLDYEISREVEKVMETPFRMFGSYAQDHAFSLKMTAEGRKHVDGESTESFAVDTGIPGNNDLSNLVPRLIFDIYLARETGLELVTNSVTKHEMQNAKALLERIEDHDFAGYLTFAPRY
ncbi:hypothetical protein KY363_03920 [Candidatus Woesearchaeota archaeon]|nr:hypothetical protein [Candidatus Woesearchaeota archaeon]